eukprot:scaffold1598_cov153-Ochromonas_danica.AAC.2
MTNDYINIPSSTVIIHYTNLIIDLQSQTAFSGHAGLDLQILTFWQSGLRNGQQKQFLQFG